MRLAAILIAALALTAATAQADQNVTGNPTIRADLALAETFWTIDQPTLTAPCAPEQVFVTSMTNAQGVNGATITAGNVWAETAIGGCAINLSPAAWAYAQTTIPQEEWETCMLIAHEYGHTLGLPDTTTIPMMHATWNGNNDPLCIQHVYGWARTPHSDREWLAEHHLDQRHDKGTAKP